MNAVDEASRIHAVQPQALVLILQGIKNQCDDLEAALLRPPTVDVVSDTSNARATRARIIACQMSTAACKLENIIVEMEWLLPYARDHATR